MESDETAPRVVEWVNDGAQVHPNGAGWVVSWRPADGSGARATTTWGVLPELCGESQRMRYRWQGITVWTSGTWSSVTTDVGSYAYETKREALAWARRLAEVEAANRRAISWDGVPPGVTG